MTAGATAPAGAGVVADVRALCERAERLAHGGPLAERARAVRERLDGPLRIALAGRIKAGKSTLLNALVGERLAATDAGECTRMVTVYRHADGYEVSARLRDGAERRLGFRRVDGALELDLDGLHPDDVEVLDVGWPASVLRRVTLIDTPGLGSLDEANSRRTVDFLDHDADTPSGADAVIYLMRHLHRSDAEFLGAFMDRSVTGASPVNAVAILSRADEVGACRLDALDSATRIADRYAADQNVRTLVATVGPLAGLLAETGLTLREPELAALRELAALPDDEVERLLLSADDFCEVSATPLTAEVRRDLLDRLGMFGARFALGELRAGTVTTATELSRALVRRSGLAGLQELIDTQFVPRGALLQARTAVVALRGLAAELAAVDPAAASALRRDLDELEAGAVDFAQLQAAHLVLSGTVPLPAAERAEVERILTTGDLAAALGVDGAGPDERRRVALAGIERWRQRASDPLATSLATSVAETMARLHERLYVTG
ncbi:MAG TPA: dynamin family protein [Acidimicrobiales bacterium]|nr:dynamin family protein [Acidimicrobiales bacterium]